MAPHRLPCRLACLLAAAVAAAPGAAAETRYQFRCQVTGREVLDRLASRGGAAELSQFTCRVRGGLLDGFVATGTNLWEGRPPHGVLLGSIVVARKADTVVVYEVQEATRRAAGSGSRPGEWEGSGRGIYKLATGAAAPLAGKSFRSMARSSGSGTFTIETTVD